MSGSGERKIGSLRPDFNRRIKLDFQGASLSSDTGFLLFRETDERFGIIEGIVDPWPYILAQEDLAPRIHARRRKAQNPAGHQLARAACRARGR